MGILTYPTALQVVQDSLMDLIRLGLGYRIPVADLTALIAINSAGVRNKQPAYVTSVTNVFTLDKSSTATVNGSTVLAPTDVGVGPGRWLKASSTIIDSTGTLLSQVAMGYVKRVMLWSGEFSEDIWKVRVLNQRPAVVLQYAGETKDIESNQRGNLTRKQYHFSLWGVSQNLRPDLEAETGSPIAADANDPGIIRIMGDLEYLLDGLTGPEMAIDGLDFLMLDAAQPGVEDYDGREYIWTAPLDVRITAGKDNPTATAMTATFVQMQGVSWPQT